MRDDHRGGQDVHREAAHDHGDDRPARPAALRQAQHAEQGDEQTHVLAHKQQQSAPEQQSAVVSAVERVDGQRREWGGERDFVEVEVDQALYRPAERVRGRDQQRHALAGPPPHEAVDDRDRRGDEHRLRDQQHVGVVPDPVQRRQDHDDRVEVVAEDVVVDALQRHDRRLEVGVRAHRLVEDAEVVTGRQVTGLVAQRMPEVEHQGGEGEDTDAQPPADRGRQSAAFGCSQPRQGRGGHHLPAPGHNRP